MYYEAPINKVKLCVLNSRIYYDDMENAGWNLPLAPAKISRASRQSETVFFFLPVHLQKLKWEARNLSHRCG